MKDFGKICTIFFINCKIIVIMTYIKYIINNFGQKNAAQNAFFTTFKYTVRVEEILLQRLTELFFKNSHSK